eukprot:SAG11_NODE_14999_length_591_cov_24.721545_1_plen_57_part_00
MFKSPVRKIIDFVFCLATCSSFVVPLRLVPAAAEVSTGCREVAIVYGEMHPETVAR